MTKIEPTPYNKVTEMIRRDFPWVICCLVLLLCLLYVGTLAADSENICDERYYDFVWACYEATGFIPDDSAYDLTLLNFTLEQRQNGSHQLVSP